MSAPTTPIESVRRWFEANGWEPFGFQEEVWAAYDAGQSGIVHAATGYGKTYAAWMGPVAEALAHGWSDGLNVLWITPLRALVNDTLQALQRPLEELDLKTIVEKRTGDTSSDTKARQRQRLPHVLVTTPESLSLLLTYANLQSQFETVRAIVVDEWHELMGSKRGTQTELGLTRVRKLAPNARTWGLSATISNLEEAKNVLVGWARSSGSRIVQGQEAKQVVVEALLPDEVERFPWSGHVGIHMAPTVALELDEAESALVFTNTRSNAEIWYQALLLERPDWAGQIAVHHGSIDRKTRRWVERALDRGDLRCVVCTSSLDLGVDFSPVDRVFQIGSPKGIARLLQRAGRSGHRPGAVSRVTCVPTHALELVEFAAAREGARRRMVEPRHAQRKPLDVLVQHLVTIALGSGFNPEELLNEVRDAWSYRELSDEEWQWALAFCETGGESLKAYDEYRRITRYNDRYICTTNEWARTHRMNIGTIASDASLGLHFLNGTRLGTVEESFAARLKKGDTFHFGGRVLEFIRIKEMKAFVRPGKSKKSTVPRWGGGRMPLSSELSAAMREMYDDARHDRLDSVEMDALAPILELQRHWSVIPSAEEVLVERAKTREGFHLYIYPFEGRLVHEGLAALMAYRMARLEPVTFTLSYNDYGIEFLSANPAPLDQAIKAGLFSGESLLEDVEHSLNASELARRQFREIARVSGLVNTGFPGKRGRSAAQIQASAGLLFDVFERHDPDNLLLQQARREVRERQLESERLDETLERMRGARLVVVDVPRVTPLGFPIMVDRLSQQRISSERLAARVARMQEALEREAEKSLPGA